MNETPVPHLNPHTILATETSRRSKLELRLVHHYATAVSYDMPECVGTGPRIWQQVIPQISFQFDLVLNPMLALSALHLHAYLPEDTIVAVAVRWYLDRALMECRQALSVANQVSEQLWLAAVLLAHLRWLLAHQKEPDMAYELPLQAYAMVQAVTTLFASGQPSLKQAGYDWFGNESLPHIPPDDELLLVAGAQLKSIHREPTHLLEGFDISSMPERDRSIYTYAKDYEIFEAFAA